MPNPSLESGLSTAGRLARAMRRGQTVLPRWAAASRMRTIRTLAAASLAFCPLLPNSALAADTWFLMARHGECSPISVLARKFPEMGTVAGPEAFVSFVRAKGLNVTSRVVPVQGNSAWEVLVPQKELSLMFVTAEVCSRVGTR
jgi:hypothetical protein